MMDDFEKAIRDAFRRVDQIPLPVPAPDPDQIGTPSYSESRPRFRDTRRWLGVAASIVLVVGVGVAIGSRQYIASVVPAVPAQTGEPSTPVGQEIVGPIWQVKSIHGVPIVLGDERTRVPYVQLKPHSEMAGDGGCNALNGAYELVGSQLTIVNLATTLSLCPGTVGEQETDFILALSQTRSARQTDSTLEFLDRLGVVVITFVAAPPSSSPR